MIDTVMDVENSADELRTEVQKMALNEVVTEHYFMQLRVYACALSQADSTRDCVLRLIFTNAEITRDQKLTPSNIERWQQRLTKVLEQNVATTDQAENS